MSIGKNIKQLRRQKQVTQEQMADYLGISYQAVSKWECGSNTPDITLLPKIAEFFGISIDTLFGYKAPDVDMLDGVIEANEEIIKDDDVVRIVLLKGKKIIDSSDLGGADSKPFEVSFRDDISNLEVYGNIITHGDVIGGNVNVAGSFTAYDDVSGCNIDCKSFIQHGGSAGCNIECNLYEQNGDANCCNIDVNG